MYKMRSVLRILDTTNKKHGTLLQNKSWNVYMYGYSAILVVDRYSAILVVARYITVMPLKGRYMTSEVGWLVALRDYERSS